MNAPDFPPVNVPMVPSRESTLARMKSLRQSQPGIPIRNTVTVTPEFIAAVDELLSFRPWVGPEFDAAMEKVRQLRGKP